MNKKMGGISMQERIYRTMGSVGIGNLVFGILLIIMGVSAGVISIVNGARLLRGKSKMLF